MTGRTLCTCWHENIFNANLSKCFEVKIKSFLFELNNSVENSIRDYPKLNIHI